MAMLGKMAISASFNMLYLYTGELLPTVVRSVGLGSCSMVARIAGMVAVYSSDLVSHIFMIYVTDFKFSFMYEQFSLWFQNFFVFVIWIFL